MNANPSLNARRSIVFMLLAVLTFLDTAPAAVVDQSQNKPGARVKINGLPNRLQMEALGLFGGGRQQDLETTSSLKRTFRIISTTTDLSVISPLKKIDTVIQVGDDPRNRFTMPKTKTKKRTQIKDLPAPETSLNSEELKKVKGGVGGPCDRPRVTAVGPCNKPFIAGVNPCFKPRN